MVRGWAISCLLVVTLFCFLWRFVPCPLLPVALWHTSGCYEHEHTGSTQCIQISKLQRSRYRFERVLPSTPSGISSTLKKSSDVPNIKIEQTTFLGFIDIASNSSLERYPEPSGTYTTDCGDHDYYLLMNPFSTSVSRFGDKSLRI